MKLSMKLLIEGDKQMVTKFYIGERGDFKIFKASQRFLRNFA